MNLNDLVETRQVEKALQHLWSADIFAMENIVQPMAVALQGRVRDGIKNRRQIGVRFEISDLLFKPLLRVLFLHPVRIGILKEPYQKQIQVGQLFEVRATQFQGGLAESIQLIVAF